MTGQDIRTVVRDLVTQIYELDDGEVQDDLDVYAAYGGDSLKKFELIAALERKYKVRFRTENERLNNVTALVKAIEERLGAGQQK